MIGSSKFNANLSWLEVLAVLGSKADPVLPSKAPCPLCNNELNLYPDIQGGAWFYCFNCKESGDMLELASKTWKLDTYTTLHKLRNNSVKIDDSMLDTRSIESYENMVLASRIRLNKFLDVSTKHLFQDSEELANLHDHLGLTSYVDPERWRTQMGKYIGWSSRIEGEIAFRPGSVGMGKRGARGKDRIFQGRYWKGVLAIYFKMLPGRVSGIWFVGRQAVFPKDWVFRWAIGGKEKEAGLGFYESVLSQSAQFGNTAFIVQDPELALLLHSKWFKDNSNQLPLVLSYEDLKAQTRTVWNQLPSRDWVFWAARPNPALFAQAACNNGRVYIGPTNTPDLNNYMILLHRIASKAKPWDKVLESELGKLSDQEVESIIYRLPLSRLQWFDILRTKTPAVKSRLLYLSEPRFPSRKVTLTSKHSGRERHTITETKDGWFVDGNLISEAVIRVETSYILKGELKHKIRIHFRGRSLGMILTNKELLNSPIQRITQLCAHRRVGAPWMDSVWARRFYEIATLFQRPRVKDEARPSRGKGKRSKGVEIPAE